MTLKRLFIQNLRNLEGVDILPSAQVNLIFGENGSGKTSILEAINLLALGRSFRSHKHKPLIRHQQQAFTVFGRVHTDDHSEVPIGITRSMDGEASFKANGAIVSSAADLAAYLPVQVINSDTFLLLEGSPKVRRQFIDWLVFHVEPQFYPAWKAIQRCLKHRNSLLRRDRIDRFELASWDQELVILTEKIHELRTACMAEFESNLSELLHEFVKVEGIKLSYYRGWDKERDYSDILAEGFERDQRLGYTQMGSHRADLKITVNGQDAAELLSRGQQKLLVCALKIAQGYVFSRMTGRKSIYLVDDLPAELDEKHRKLLVHWLHAMQTQIFITGVEQEALLSSWRDIENLIPKMFHVEQGRVKEISEVLVSGLNE
ncbi:DNA replication/repair protein RecF [Cellvibrio sp. KY-YJ-3]|uniref:DNA replication/repair protein RecF n=1 Tax=Cellvibrio sp. KY-YJ-3 TaxID=454662 RepID=UPI001247F30F|nr:DNA replication/repair protein RecF [Cellvibrio sp. KY-YJ-3]QEY11473.1 DNA replication/repair protein RecF [Cellvibrio sp. KY-YJ-3]